ncbi:hypothetical protein VYU27_000019 [Nannochloropsis oceanica]
MKRKIAATAACGTVGGKKRQQAQKRHLQKMEEEAAAAEGYSSSSSSSSSKDSADEIKLYEKGEVDDESSSSSSSSSSSEEEEDISKTAQDKGKGQKQISDNPTDLAKASKGSKKAEKKEKDEGGGKDVEVSFDFSDPDERFFFGIRSLLQWLAPEGVNVTSLAELIVQEKGLGSIIHCTNETDVFAFVTTLNIKAHQGNAGMLSLCERLLRPRCPASLKSALEKALSSPETFVFLHGRFVNLPLPLIPLLHKSSHDDMAWAQSSEASFPRIKQVLTVSPCTVDLGGGQKASLPYAPNDAIYDRFEDEIMVQAAEMNYCFSRRTEGEGEGRKDGGRGKEDGKEKGKDVEDNYDHDDVPPQKKKKEKKKQKVTGGNEDCSEGGQGLVVSLVETKVLQENLLQIEEMVG